MTFRSLDMKHYTLIIQMNNAYTTINKIAQLGNTHFVDSGDQLNRYFMPQLKRVQELLTSINMMNYAAKMAGYSYKKYNQSQNGFTEKLFKIWEMQAKALGVEDIKVIDYYEHQINKQFAHYQEILGRLDKLKLRKKQLMESIAIQETISSFFGSPNLRQESSEYYNNFVNQGSDVVSGISYVIGIVSAQSQDRFNRMIYRVSRGYACTRSLDTFKFAGLNNFNQKVVMVIYPSSNTAVLERKIQRVVQMFCNSVTQLNKDGIRQQQAGLARIQAQFSEVQNYLTMNEQQLKQLFQHIYDLGCLQKWNLFLWKQKCVYETLNKLQVRGSLLLSNIYVARDKILDLSHSISQISPTPTLQEIKLGSPPTAFSTNSYTSIAQQITDTYGVPRYKQMNPSIFTTITFPFFFGVMFGDIGHGAVLFSLGLYLVFNDSWISKKGGAFKIFSRLRYMITLMGFFAFYCGWVYNDLIGFNYNFFGSCYDPLKVDHKDGNKIHRIDNNCVYPFGIDPIWGRAENQLVYVNSLKMKISVIIAIVHMTFGILVKAMNSLYFKKTLDFWFQFVPQVVFMVGLFGYMDFLIVFKWLKPWDQSPDPDIPPTSWAPSIISSMMNIGLAMGKTSTKPDGSSPMWGPIGHSSQDLIQLIILIAAFLCIPTMLLPKPLIQISHMKKKTARNVYSQQKTSIIESIESEVSLQKSLLNSQNKINPSSVYDRESSNHSKGAQSHEDAGQIFVHQLIQTIQFALGAVSNTASYLRLWALSLAHSQLANVFFEKTLKNTMELKGVMSGIPNVIGFWLLCWITFGVLMCMDSMQCFLHSLRLHWVQFQNKFYKGDGYRYQPVSIQNYLENQKETQNN